MKTLVIGIPCYTGTVIHELAGSLLSCLKPLADEYEVMVDFEPGNCYVSQARNFIAARFLASNADYLLYVDADIGFSPDAIPRLLSVDKPLVCGLYQGRKEGKVLYYPYLPVVRGEPPRMEKDFEIAGGPAGFMLVKREVFETLIETYPLIKQDIVLNGIAQVYSFFDTGILWEPGKWYGEDYAFCLRYRNAGGKVHAVADIPLKHVGRGVFQGSMYDDLQRSGIQ